MPTDHVAISASKVARKAGLIGSGFPPGGSVSTSGIGIERSKDTGAGQYRVAEKAFYFQPPSHPGATAFTYGVTINLTSKNDNDSAHLVIQALGSWSPSGTASVYNEGELDVDFPGDIVADVPLASLSVGANVIVFSGPVPASPFHSYRLGISIGGGTPTGLNDVSIASITYDVGYSLSATPGMLAIDGDTANGKAIGRGATHRFSWATGQVSTGYDLLYKRTSDVSFTTIHVDTPLQYHDFASGFFTDGADDTWVWKVISYDVESTASAESAQKTFSVVGSLAAPTVSPSGTVSSALLTITATGAATHTQEQYQVFEGAVKIYDTGKLTQSSNSHAMSAGYFLNGIGHLEDGKSYTLHYYYYDSAGNIGHGTASITVLFTPPNQPTVIVTAQDAYLNIAYDNPAGGAAVDHDDLLRSFDYDVNNPGAATWEKINAGDLAESSAAGEMDDSGIGGPNVRDYETAHGQQVWYKLRAWSGMAYIDSEVSAPATLELDAWVEMHDPADPSGTIVRLTGWLTTGGSESSYAQSRQPAANVQTYLGSALPVINRLVTLAGKPVGRRTWTFQSMTIPAERFDGTELKAKIIALFERAANLTIRTRTKAYPVGDLLKGGITKSQGPAPVDGLNQMWAFSFEFEESA